MPAADLSKSITLSMDEELNCSIYFIPIAELPSKQCIIP